MDQRLHKQQHFPLSSTKDEDEIIKEIIKTIIQRQQEEFERRKLEGLKKDFLEGTKP